MTEELRKLHRRYENLESEVESAVNELRLHSDSIHTHRMIANQLENALMEDPIGEIDNRNQVIEESDICNNCNVDPEDFEKGHSYREIKKGFEYDVEHLNGLGWLEVNGISLLFDRMNNRLVIQREEMSLQEISKELDRKIGGTHE